MNFFEMLMVSRKFVFEDGEVTLFDQNISIFPPEGMIEYISRIGNDSTHAQMLYSMAKKAMLENKQNLITAYKQVNKHAWVCDTINLYGLGHINYENQDDALTGTIILEDSFLSEAPNGKVNGPADHVIRGMIAGIISSISNVDTDAIETECHINNEDNNCKLIVDLCENLKRQFPDKYKEQVLSI